MFLSIGRFVFKAIMLAVFVLAFTSSGRLFQSTGIDSGIGVFTLVSLVLIAAIYFFPIYFLFQFSRYSKIGISDNDVVSLSTGFKYLKCHYRYMDVLFIIVLALYLIVGIVTLIAGNLF